MSLNVDRALKQAKRHIKKGEGDAATRLYEEILTKFPKNKRAIEGLKALRREGPGSATSGVGPSQNQISELVSLYTQGQLQQAHSVGMALAAQFPGSAFLPNLLGAVNAGLGRLDDALGNYNKALQINPDYAEAHNNLGCFLEDLGRSDDAIASYRKAIEIEPRYAEAHNNLGKILCDLGKYEEAAESYKKALKIRPDFTEAHNNLGNVFGELGRHDQEIESYRQALKIDPEFVEALNNMGTALNILGRSDEAVSYYKKALAIHPEIAEAYNNLSRAYKFQSDDPLFQQMENVIAQNKLSDSDRMHLSFALGKAYDDVGNTEKAFPHFLNGNRIRKEFLNYDISTDRQLFEEIKDAFSSDFETEIANKDSVGTNDLKPIFILGMNRSGTSLVEQILASHSRVHGAGELQILDQALDIIDWKKKPLSEDQLIAIRNSYLTGLEKLEASERIITDKMPPNFRWIGFILTAMPNARIIHTKRDARATCWSNFTHYFSRSGSGYVYDLHDLAEYYKLYDDLMAFWEEIFPGQIYHLHYEKLTENQKEETVKLLEFAGLEWEEQCLDFHKTKRVVATASSTQVRKKMYQGSSDAWLKYKEHLGPLLDGLEGY